MNRPRRLAVLAAALATLTVSACGAGDDAADEPAPAETSPDTAAPGGTTGDTGDVVDPTISPDLPEEALPGIGPLGVIGEPLPLLPPGGEDPAIGMSAPVLVGQNFDGEQVRLDPAADGPTWVVFLAHWCPHCNDEIPVINQLRDDGLIPDGIEVVGVSTSATPDRPNFPPGPWLDDKDWTFEAIADGYDTDRNVYIGAEAFGVSGFPFSALVDGDGTVTARWSGERPPTEIVTMLTEHLAAA